MVQFAAADLPAVLPLLEQGEGIASRNGGEGGGSDGGAGDSAGTDADRGTGSGADGGADGGATCNSATDARLFVAFGVIERDSTGAARFREVDALVAEPHDYQELCRSRTETSPAEEDSESGFAGNPSNSASDIAKGNEAKAAQLLSEIPLRNGHQGTKKEA